MTDRWLDDLRARLRLAGEQAWPLLLAGDDDGVEAMIRNVNRDVYGAVTLTELYAAAARHLAGSGNRRRFEEMVRLALHWCHNSFPMAHTQDEADAATAAVDELRSELAKLRPDEAHDPNT